MTEAHPYARGRGSTRRRWATAAGIGLVGGPLIAGWMVLPVASATSQDKVDICHATGSVSNPYIVAQVDASSVDEEGNQFLNGHGDHTGPVFDPTNPQDSWGDIIPPIESPTTDYVFPGLNWPEGEAIWSNGCQVPMPSPTETSPSPTETSPSPTETSPSPTETSPSPTETSPSPTETTPGPTVTVTVTATQVIVVPGPGVTTTVTATPTPTSPTPTTVTPSPGTTTPTPTETTVTPSPGTTTPTPTETTVTPSPGTTTPTATTLSPSPGVTVTGTGLPTGVAAGGGPMQGLPGIGDPLRPPVLWAASAGLTAMGLIALARMRRLNSENAD